MAFLPRASPVYSARVARLRTAATVTADPRGEKARA